MSWHVRAAIATLVVAVFASGCDQASSTPTRSPFGPSWLPGGILGALSCDGPILAMGAGADADSLAGSAQAPSLAQSIAMFRNSEARVYAWLPLEGYDTIRTDAHFSLLAHRVDGRSRAVALFANVDVDGHATEWTLAQVAACDPSEFAPGVAVSYGLRVWTQNGKRVSTATILDTVPPCKAAELLRVEGRTFVRSPSTSIGAVQGPYVSDGIRPSDAVETPYTEGGRSLWLSPDGSAAWIETDTRVERWPRLIDGDPSSIDCG